MTVRSELMAKVLDREVPGEVSFHLQGINNTMHYEDHDDSELDHLSRELFLDYIHGLRLEKEGYVLVGEVGYSGQEPMFSTRTGTQNLGSSIVFDYRNDFRHLNDIVSHNLKMSRPHQKNQVQFLGNGTVEDELTKEGVTTVRYEDVEAIATNDVDPHFFEGDESAYGARTILSNRLSPEMRRVYRKINRQVGKELN